MRDQPSSRRWQPYKPTDFDRDKKPKAPPVDLSKALTKSARDELISLAKIRRRRAEEEAKAASQQRTGRKRRSTASQKQETWQEFMHRTRAKPRG